VSFCSACDTGIDSCRVGDLGWRAVHILTLSERTKAGLEAARRDGRIGGRRPKLTPQQQAEILRMVSKGNKTAADAARLFAVHPATVSRLLSQARARSTLRHTK
jgi:DNA invertase Pin-like site-specific DNA recombinase